MFESSLFRMLISLLIILLISNAITFRRDKSILNNRIGILIISFSNIIVINNILELHRDFEVYIYNNMLHINYVRLLLYLVLSNINIYIIYKKMKQDYSIYSLVKFTGKSLYRPLFNIVTSFFPKLELATWLFITSLHLPEVKMSVLPTEEGIKLGDDMNITLRHMANMVTKLRHYKRRDGIRYIINDGNLSIDVPNSMSDTDANKLTTQVGIADRVFNSELEKYKELLNKDESLNGKLVTPHFEKNYQRILSDHKDLFDNES